MQNQQSAQMPLLDQFKQQMLKAWQPVPSLTKTIIMFFILALIFLGLGIPMLILSQDITQVSIRYDDQPTCSIGSKCTLNIQIPTDMTPPIYVYYQLNNYFQNHRLYAKSVSIKQLLGNQISTSEAESDCDPIVYNANISVKKAIDNTTLDPDAIANPCGIIAFTIFNDSYSLQLNGQQIDISDTGIAWPTDINRYKIVNQSQVWYNITQQRFINWMRIAAMPDFRKLWGRIQNQLSAGTYKVTIQNNYDISSFNGEKYFVISQSNFFGSRNDFLSITYIVVGSFCLITAIVFLVKKLMKKRKTS